MPSTPSNPTQPPLAGQEGNTPQQVPANQARASAYQSFWMAGFEGADHTNSQGIPLDMGKLTQHEELAASDYAALREYGIATVRETVGWRLTEKNGQFDFNSLLKRLEAARRYDMQITWTLCHYGWPDDVDVFNDTWIDRFALFCNKASEFIATHSDAVPIYTPINEISFLTWALCESSLIYPSRGNRAGDSAALKQRLVKGFIAGCEAIWRVDPRARILAVDPVVHITHPAGQPHLAAQAMRQRSYQFQAWDMLGGFSEPQLGGHPKYLDMVGVNYYHDNQWEYGTFARLHWHLKDPRRVPLSHLLQEVAKRYAGHNMILAETSHVGVGRGEWISEIAQEVVVALQAGVPLDGICLYPIVDRPDWEDHSHWHNSGLWDREDLGTHIERRLCQPYADQIRLAQAAVQSARSRLTLT